MTPRQFAEIVDRAYAKMEPWGATGIAATLALPTTVFLHRQSGGLIAQVAGEDCEILVLATDPSAQRCGIATSLLADLDRIALERGATRIILEVASQNTSARAFYAAEGFARIGQRKGYYTLRDGTKDDALLLSRPVPWGQCSDPSNTRQPATKSG